MALLRWLYDALAILGASVLAILGVAIVYQFGADQYRKAVAEPRVEDRPAVVSRPAAVSSPPVARSPVLPVNPLPMPVGRARAQVVATNQRVFKKSRGYNVPEAGFAWVERHGNDYLLVTDERGLLIRSNSTRELVLRMPDGRALLVQEHRLADSTRVAYVRFCGPPPDSLFVEYVTPDSVTPLRSERCPL